MPTYPRPQRPDLHGAEAGLFDLLLAAHIKFLHQRERICDLARGQGINDKRVQSICEAVMIYTTPPQLRGTFEKALQVAMHMPDLPTGSKPS